MINVVHPAYHCRPNGGHGSFCPAANLRLSCVLVLATVGRGQILKCWASDFAVGRRTLGGIGDGYKTKKSIVSAASPSQGNMGKADHLSAYIFQWLPPLTLRERIAERLAPGRPGGTRPFVLQPSLELLGRWRGFATATCNVVRSQLAVDWSRWSRGRKYLDMTAAVMSKVQWARHRRKCSRIFCTFGATRGKVCPTLATTAGNRDCPQL